MIVEIVTWDIKPNLEKDFELAFEKAQEILAGAKEYISHQFLKCIEKTNRYSLLVSWETLEDHTEGFRNSTDYQEFRAMLSQYYMPGATMEHYETISRNA